MDYSTQIKCVILLTFLFYLKYCEAKSYVDRVCILSKDVGEKCEGGTPPQATMYHFDKDQEKCVTFIYLGCGGNDNKFGTSDDCIDSCKMPYLLKKEKNEDAAKGTSEPHKKSDCGLAPEAGPCKAIITMWFYDKKSHKCDTFGYGGCNGNGNKFDNRQECESYCGDSKHK